MIDRVPTSQWACRLPASTIVSVVPLTLFQINIGEATLALNHGLLFSSGGVQSAGQTDADPVSVTSKTSQLTSGGIGKWT